MQRKEVNSMSHFLAGPTQLRKSIPSENSFFEVVFDLGFVKYVYNKTGAFSIIFSDGYTLQYEFVKQTR